MEEFDDSGLSQSEFEAEERERQEEIGRVSSKEYHNPEKIFFIFENPEERDRALKLIAQERQFNDLFRYLNHWRNDPLRKDVGLEMDFLRHPPELRKKLEEFFQKNGFNLKEEYEAIEEKNA